MKVHPHIKCSGLWKAPERDLSSVLLDLNENQFLKTFLDGFVTCELQSRDLFTYPNYQPLLLELSRYCDVTTNNLLLTNGADQAIDLLVRSLFSPGDRVVMPSPVFSFYYQMLSVNGVEPSLVAFEKSDQGFVLPSEAIIESLQDSHGLILCNPNNPLGVSLESEQMNALIEVCVQRDIPVIVDECYFEYLQQSCLDTFIGVRQLFVIRSFSKYFGLAGLRLGYVIAHPELIRELLKVRGPWDINHVAVKAALYCLNNLDVLKQAHQELEHVKSEITGFCRALNIVVYDSDTNFLLLEDQDDGLLATSFVRSNIRVSNCSNYPHSFGLLVNVLRVAVPATSDLKAFLMAVLQGSDHQSHGAEIKVSGYGGCKSARALGRS